MNPIFINEKIIRGFSARTNNAAEMNPATGKIAPLVKYFDDNVTVDYRGSARVYSVYYDYESDVSGDYSVLIGADHIASATEPLVDIAIASGEYLVFSGKGQMPQLVFDLWSRVWDYFSDEACAYVRAYTTDFEFYKSQDEVDIHIAIQSSTAG